MGREYHREPSLHQPLIGKARLEFAETNLRELLPGTLLQIFGQLRSREKIFAWTGMDLQQCSSIKSEFAKRTQGVNERFFATDHDYYLDCLRITEPEKF